MKENNYVESNLYMREKKKYYIYIHTCPNNMCYVGLSKNPEMRWNNGEGYKDNITHEIVAETYYGWIDRKIEKDLISKFKKCGKAYNVINENKEYTSKRKIPLKKVGKYDKDGNLIKVYESATDAWRDTHISIFNIQSCCRGKTKTSGGYIWKYL